MSRTRRLVYALLVLVAFLAAAEGLARWLGPGVLPPDHSRDAAPGEPVPGSPNLVGDAVAGWRIVPGANRLFGVPRPTWVNSRGLRGREIPLAKRPGERRVLVLGDSSVYGVMVADEDTFAARLQRALRAIDPGITVLNGGCPGYSSWQARRVLEARLLAYDPDLVVVATLWSDTQGADRPDSVRFGERAAGRLAALLQRSHAYLALRDAIVRARWGSPVPPPSDGAPEPVGFGLDLPRTPTWRVPLDEYAENLDAMAELAAGEDAATCFLVLPCVRDVDDGRVGDFRDAWRDEMRAAARRHDAILVDTPAAFVGADPDRMFLDEVHPSPAGHARIAELLAAGLADWARRRPSP